MGELQRGRCLRVGVIAVLVLVLAACQTTKRESQSSQGAQGDGPSSKPAISDDGRFLAFASSATNLAPGDSNGASDVFVRDRQAATTTRVSVSTAGAQANGPSGRYADSVAISGDGRYVAFTSQADNLVGGDTNGQGDVFVHDRQTGTTSREATTGTSPDLDDTGTFLAYQVSDLAGVPNAGKILVRDRRTGEAQVIPTGTEKATDPDLSGDGRFVAFVIQISSEDGSDAWLYDRTHQLLDRLTYTRDGVQGPEVSDDGQTVVAWNGGSDQVLIVNGGRISRISGLAYGPTVSDDGRWITYSTESDIAPEDTNGYTRDVYLRDQSTGEDTYQSVGSGGQAADGQSFDSVISGDGRLVAFSSDASNLVDGDTNGVTDVFVRDRGAATTSPAG